MFDEMLSKLLPIIETIALVCFVVRVFLTPKTKFIESRDLFEKDRERPEQ